MEGKPMKVEAYSACPRVRLSLNGLDLGAREVSRDTRYRATWEVPYAPGTLKVTGYEGERATEEWTIVTAGKPAKLGLSADRDSLSADGADLAFVTVSALDNRGNANPVAENLVRFRVEGPASLEAVGSGNPRCVEGFRRPERRLFEGRCLAVVRAGRAPGTATLWAESSGMGRAGIRFDLK
jgi:beta-galactosidase